MKIRQFVVDAFADQLFAGNPAAVCPLTEWLPDALLQTIASENNLSETAFFVPEADHFRLRWFTPAAEVPLCGHATLASAHVLFTHLGFAADRIRFNTLSGMLEVARLPEGVYQLDFPARHAKPCAIEIGQIEAALHARPLEVLETDVCLAVFAHEDIIRTLNPDIAAIQALPHRAVIVTAPGLKADFVSRFFAPKMGIPEDPVTGSAHCVLTPFWAQRLGKTRLQAQQLSARGGKLLCEWRDPRVTIAGKAFTFLEGEITLPD